MRVAKTANGPRRDSARAVIDASGTWRTPNPLGAGGIAAEGEAELAGRIAYGIPDVLADGIMTHHQVTPGTGGAAGTLTIRGTDLSALM